MQTAGFVIAESGHSAEERASERKSPQKPEHRHRLPRAPGLPQAGVPEWELLSLLRREAVIWPPDTGASDGRETKL